MNYYLNLNIDFVILKILPANVRTTSVGSADTAIPSDSWPFQQNSWVPNVHRSNEL